MSKLPKLDDDDPSVNELKSRFDGKLQLKYAFAQLLFIKSGITQNLLHEFKYNNKPEIGELFGKQLGAKIKECGLSDSIDLMIPVPLHPKKERQRGYNQSHYFARGISEITGIPVDFKSLQRVKHRESQTGKSREKRWRSVEDAFELRKKVSFESKQILLVDDVVTTGATLEACGILLKNAGAKNISVATLAIAK